MKFDRGYAIILLKKPRNCVGEIAFFSKGVRRECGERGYYDGKYKNKRLPIKTLILEQSIIAGIGNIYANEILFASSINPLKSGVDLSDKELESIINNTRDILSKAIEMGGSTIHSYTSVDGVTGLFQQELMVHTRVNQKCKVCGTNIEKIVVGGRGTYYCPNCQK